MEKEVPQKIMERIQHLLNFEADAKDRDSLHEAENAAAQIQRLLIKYNLSLMDVEEVTNIPPISKEVIETMGREKKSEGTWIKDLWAAIARHNYCKVLVFGKGKWVISLHGEPHNREVVTDLVLALIPRIRKMKGKYFKQYQTENGWEKKGAWTRGFYRGAVMGIDAKLTDQYKSMEEEMPEVQEMGLVKVDQMQKYMGDYNPKMKTVLGTKSSGYSGQSSGYDAGKGMSINRGIGGQSGNKLLT